MKKPYPSVAMICSYDLMKLIPLHSGPGPLQVVHLQTIQRTQWMYFPRF